MILVVWLTQVIIVMIKGFQVHTNNSKNDSSDKQCHQWFEISRKLFMNDSGGAQ